jgi:hypothetical protein
MAQIVAQFFNIIGVDAVPPETLAELIPYLFTVMIGLFLVAAVFKVIAAIIGEFIGMRRM